MLDRYTQGPNYYKTIYSKLTSNLFAAGKEHLKHLTEAIKLEDFLNASYYLEILDDAHSIRAGKMEIEIIDQELPEQSPALRLMKE